MTSDRRLPRIFVSSTCFDLRQIRDELRRFIEDELGYTALLSEQPSFPVDPHETAVENCLRRVRDDTDVFVLIIGDRYGHVPPGSERSVVNLEYATAKEAGIPVFAFLYDRIVPQVDAWGSTSRETPAPTTESRLLEFATDVRKRDQLWTFQFGTAGDIVQALRVQLAYRVHATLRLLHRLERREDADQLLDLPPEALKHSVEQRTGWPGFMFAALLKHLLARSRTARDDYDSGVALGAGDAVQSDGIFPWLRSNLHAVERLVSGLGTFVNDRLTPAFAGGNVDQLIRAAHSIAGAYVEALEWARRIRCVWTPKRWTPVRLELSKCVQSMLDTIRSLPSAVDERLSAAISAARTGEPIVVNLKFEIRIENVDEVTRLMDETRNDPSDD